MKRFTKGALAAVLATMFVGAGSQAQESGAEAMEEIVVLGIRASQQRALDLKRDSEVVVDAIALEEIGKFPDQNVAEALQRIVGVSITRERGEGTEVSVRGLGPTFNVVTLNNRTTASVLNTRSFDFQTLPSELISGAQVFKSVDASMVEGSIGGTINIATLRPLDFNQRRIYAGSVTGRYTDLAEDTNVKLSGVFGGKFADDTVGLIVGFAYDDRSSRIDTAGGEGHWVRDVQIGGVLTGDRMRVERARNYQLQLEDRERTTVTAGLQFQPNDRLDLNFDYLYTALTVDKDEIRQQHVLFFRDYADLVISGNNTALSFTKPSGDIVPDLIRVDEFRDTETQMFGFNTVFHATDNLSFEFDAAYSKATSDADPSALQNSFAVIRSVGPDVSGAYDSTGSIPTLQLSRDLHDLSYRPFFTDFNAEDLEDEATDIKLSALWSVDKGILSSIDTGVQYVDRSKLETQYRSPNACAYCGPSFVIPATSFQQFPVSNLLEGHSGFQNQWPVLDNQEYMRLVTEQDADRAAGLLPVLRPGQGTNIDEETMNFFVQANLAGEWGDKPWSGNIGVRYVNTDLVTRGATTELVDVRKLNNDPLDGNIVIETVDSEFGSINNDYSEVLPSFNFKLSLRDETLLRFAAAKVISRPNLRSLSTANNFQGNGDFFSSSGGNPYLDPFQAWQYDLGIEFYPSETSAYSATLFYKDIDTFISTIGTLVETEFSLTLPPPTGVVDPVVFSDTREQNTPGGTVKGLELSALYSFVNLPGAFDGLGVQFNYTYADTKSNYEPTSVQEFAAPFPSALEGFAENSFNAILFYEKDKISTRLAYNWVDDYLFQRQVGIGQLPLYFASYGQLDFSFAYNITENLTLNFDGINMTDEHTETYQDYRERVEDFEFTGRRYMFGIRGSW